MQKNISNFIYNEYNLKIKYIKELKGGFSNINYKVFTKDGEKFVFRLSRMEKLKHLDLESYIINSLNMENKYVIPQKVESKKGRDWVEFNSTPATLFNFISGKTKNIDNIKNKDEFYKDLSIIITKIHSLPILLDKHKQFTGNNLFADYLKKINSYSQIVRESDKEWKVLFRENLTFITKQLRKEIINFDKVNNRLCYVHNDLRMPNFLFKNDKFVAMIDFDDVAIRDRAYDLALIFVENFMDKEVISTKINDFVAIEEFKDFLNVYEQYTNVNSELLRKITYEIVSTAFPVLSFVGRDPDFDDNIRMKNIGWYTNIVKLFSNRKQKEKIFNTLRKT